LLDRQRLLSSCKLVTICNGIVTDFYAQLPGNASDPDTTYDDLLPVIYWIHGGGFSLGSVLTYSAEKYMDKDVVLVEVQYRLGPLGWLSLNTDEVPGNAGLFDQIEGLKWTQKFVKYFGGNPNSVTIAGESAGSASVSTLLLAPQARGKFELLAFILISSQY
jgi:carboxylesterase type B